MPDDSAGDAMLPPIRPFPKSHRCLFFFPACQAMQASLAERPPISVSCPPGWLRARLRHRCAVVSNMGPAMDAKQSHLLPANTPTSDGGPAQTLPDSAHCAALVSKRWTMAPDKWIESTGARLRP
ncbi:hypothetical protein GGP41_008544 [Bipolaris sorokiniana]|uniref:Uncharacterized protein n=1 Tax=Cochliobolus sativus TaxID=45130 RepID=A0A8H5Z9D4_COCSA|nr:hypothetical protein GGP41_008544 [Bipolaris sorokiniana]